MRMNSRVLLAALFATTTVQAAEAPPPTPLITLPVAWGLMGNGGPNALPGRCDLGIDALKSVDANVVYSVRCASTVLPSFGGARMSFDAARYRGKRVRVSAGVMAADVSTVANAQYPNIMGEAGLWIGVGTPRDGLRTDRMQNRAIKGTTGWETLDFVVDIPADAGQLQAGFWMQGKGQIWVRDLIVEEVPTTVPVNFDRNAPKPDDAPDLSLLTATAPRPEDRFLPPPQKWLALGEANFELCDLGVDARMLAAGQRNLSIACSVPVRAYLRQAFVSPPWWGKRVRFSAWIKTENVESRTGANAQLGLAQSAAGGAALYISASDTNGPVYNAVVTGTTGWTYKELVIEIPAGAPYIPIGVSLIGTGQVWARDLKFEEVSRDTPLTLLPVANR
jgi:hypothetical protein